MSSDQTGPLVFRSEFTVHADLVTAGEELRFEGRDGYTTVLRNAEKNEHGEVPGLYAVVIGPANSLDEAMDEARSALARQLDLLAFTTQSRYQIGSAVRTLEWMPHQKKIHIIWGHETDARYPPAPELRSAYIETAAVLDRADLPGYVRTALREFRRGLLEKFPEDQFMSFWLALEVIAENTKEKNSVPIPCGKCKASLACSACGHTPTRIPMPKGRITELIHTRVGKTHGKSVSKGLFEARNRLMHGGSVESIEQACKGTMHAIANALADVVFHAIFSLTDALEPHGKMLHRQGEFLPLRLALNPRGSFDHDGVEPYPREGTIPSLKVRHIVEFRPKDPPAAGEQV